MDSTCVQDAFLGRLSTERIRNHLDMRHRLDKDGKRYGKVINYKCEAFAHRQLCPKLYSMHHHLGIYIAVMCSVMAVVLSPDA